MTTSNQKDTVCLLGGTGFVGSAIAVRLVRAGYAVTIPTRNRQRGRKLLVLPGLELVQANIHNPEQLNQLVAGSSAVINLIGILNEKGHDGSGFQRAHVELTEKIVSACRKQSVKRIVQMSALKANAERGPSHYLRTKGEAEQVLRNKAGDSINVTIFRPSVIFGPDDSFTNRFARMLKMSPILPMVRLESRFAPVYVNDVAEAFVRSLNDSRSYGETYELCGPDIYTLEEILRFLCREMDMRRAILKLPPPLDRMAAWVGDYLVPGKPISVDNFRSLTVASVCQTNGFGSFGIKPARMQPIVRQYINGGVDEFSEIRQGARG